MVKNNNETNLQKRIDDTLDFARRVGMNNHKIHFFA
jgi:hypothetical protein